MRLIEYVRVSKVGGRDNLQSPTEQREANRHIVALTPGAEIIETIEELDESGGTMERPGIKRAIEMVESGQADGIVVAWLDRWARTEQALSLIERWAREGKTFISAAERFDATTSHGRFALGMMLLVAKYYRDRTVERWDISTRNAIKRGVHTTVPYGYRRANGKGSPLVPDEAQAPVVQRIFAEHASDTGIAAIAAGLNADGIPAARAAEWTRQAVRALLRSRTYLGEASYGEHVTVDAHPAIVTAEQWHAAQPNRGTWKRNGDASLLSGLVRCAGCGYIMGAGSSNGARRYNCNRHHATGACPSPTTASADGLERLVQEQFFDHYGHARLDQAGEATAEIDRAHDAVSAAERELAAYLDAVSVADVGAEAFRAGAQSRRQAVDDARDALHHAVRDAQASRLTIDGSLWATLTMPERRDLLRAGINAISISRAASTATPLAERVEIGWTGEDVRATA